MTQITMIYDNNLIIGFRMEGHAEFNVKGPDIVCASLSAVSQLTINGIIDWVGLDVHELVHEIDEAKGILDFEIPPAFYYAVTVQQLLKSFEMYVEQLAEFYKENVKLERRQKDDNRN